MVKQLLLFSALILSFPSLGRGVAQAVRTKQIISLQELQQATDYLFLSFAKMLAKGTSIEYNTYFFYFASPADEPHLYPADHLLSLNIEAGIDYFNVRFAEVLRSGGQEEAAIAAAEFFDWRDDTVKRADDLLAEVKIHLAENADGDTLALQNIIAQMDLIKENLFSLPRDDTPLFFQQGWDWSRPELERKRSLFHELWDFPNGIGTVGVDHSKEPEEGMIHGRPATP